MIQYRNTGAQFTRDNGSKWLHNEIHTPTENELKRRVYKLRPAPGEVETPRTAQVVATPDNIEGEEKWILTMRPDVYLKLHPEGGHAALAKRMLAAERAKQTDEEADDDSDD